jgi:phage-related protein
MGAGVPDPVELERFRRGRASSQDRSRSRLHVDKLVLDIYLEGEHATIAWYVDAGGAAHGRDYYEALDVATRSKFTAPMRYIAGQALYRNAEKYRDEGDGIRAIKVFKHRLMCFRDDHLLVVTHGFQKKSDDLPAGEKDRALRLRREYHSRKA